MSPLTERQILGLRWLTNDGEELTKSGIGESAYIGRDGKRGCSFPREKEYIALYMESEDLDAF